MKLNEVIKLLDLHWAHEADAECDVEGIYCGDLLSDVLAHLQPGAIWCTVMGHVNIVAVADLRDAAAVIIVNGGIPDPQTLAKARSQGVNICTSPATAAELIMQLAGKL